LKIFKEVEGGAEGGTRKKAKKVNDLAVSGVQNGAE
jgi:hypothetical protein